MIESTVSGIEIGTMSVAGVAILGLFVTWIRNGKSQAKHMSEMEGRQSEQIKTIFNKLDENKEVLGAIKESVEGQKNHCAGVVGRFDERIKSLEGKKTKEMTP